MTEFVLITMLCYRACVPVQAEVFPNKAACEAAIKNVKINESVHCAPVVKTK